MNNLNNLSSLVFDFDGTLGSGLDTHYDVTCLSLKCFGIYPPSKETYRRIYDQTDGFKKMTLKMGVPEYLLEKFQEKFMDVSTDLHSKNSLELILHTEGVIEKLHSVGKDLYILSLTHKKHLEKKIDINWASRFFKEIITLDPGKENKTNALSDLKNKIRREIIYFGDTLSDGQSCLEAGVLFGAMIHPHSYNPEEMLLEFVKRYPGKAVAVNGIKDILNLCGIKDQI